MPAARLLHPAPADPAALRAAYACIPQGVTALCALDDTGAPRGITASSTTTVSLDPPLTCVAIARTSTTWPLLRARPRLGVSVLSHAQNETGRALAAPTGDRFAGIDWHPTGHGSVLLNGALLWMECVIDSELPAGDHQIVLLRIRNLSAQPDQDPLVLHAAPPAQLAAAVIQLRWEQVPNPSAPPPRPTCWTHSAWPSPPPAWTSATPSTAPPPASATATRPVSSASAPPARRLRRPGQRHPHPRPRLRRHPHRRDLPRHRAGPGRRPGRRRGAARQGRGRPARLAAGILELHGSWLKRMHPGWAAHCGITAVTLAESGFRGPATVFEGGGGLYASHLGEQVNAEDLGLPDLGRRWMTTDIALKPYPCCHFTHAFADAARALLGELGVTRLDPQLVQRIECPTAPALIPMVTEPAARKIAPATIYDALFSVQYVTATALAGRAVDLATFYDEPLDHPDILALAALTTCPPDTGADFPRHFPEPGAVGPDGALGHAGRLHAYADSRAGKCATGARPLQRIA